MSAPAWIAVGVLGGVAAGARFLLDAEITLRRRGRFPLGILAVNLLGALALGIVAAVGLDGQGYMIAAGGVIGSFTTFSTWILDSHRLATSGAERLAALNIGLSLLAGFVAVTVGHWLGSLL